MEVTLLKDHNGKKAGDLITVTPERANYYVLCGVAAYSEGYVPKKPEPPKAPRKPKADKVQKEPKKPKQTKELKQNLETK